MKIVVGIDLAGSPKNKSGFCLLSINEKTGEKKVLTRIVYSDEYILKELDRIEPKPDIVAIDAPIIYSGFNRVCDDELKEYGALPVTLRGMEILAKRGSILGKEIIAKGYNLIEINSSVSSKILGFWDKRERTMQKSLIDAHIKGDIERRFLCKDELDAIFAAITGYLHLTNASVIVGNDDGRIIIPKV